MNLMYIIVFVGGVDSVSCVKRLMKFVIKYVGNAGDFKKIFMREKKL